MDNNIYEIKFYDENNKESVLVIQSDAKQNMNKNSFRIISYKGDISKIENNISGKSINKIASYIKSQKLEIISIIIIN